jgi:hypothetical protein
LCWPNILLPIHLRSTAGTACLSLRVFSVFCFCPTARDNDP